ncbi:MAG: hypothetical protein MR428_01910 [Mesosutterella sp.]|nr:hypothetical protein [Mesosutterella sp.]
MRFKGAPGDIFSPSALLPPPLPVFFLGTIKTPGPGAGAGVLRLERLLQRAFFPDTHIALCRANERKVKKDNASEDKF